MPFVIAGMALGRLDLAARAVQRRLAVLGPVLIVLGYGGSWLAQRLFDVVPPALPAGSGGSLGTDPGQLAGQLPTHFSDQDVAVSFLLSAEPHTGTSFDVIGCLGVAITVLVAATVAMTWLRLRRPAGPVIAVGTMSLTLYVAHVAAYALLPKPITTWVPLAGFVAGAIVFATVWSRFFRRGPLEYLMHQATQAARRIR